MRFYVIGIDYRTIPQEIRKEILCLRGDIEKYCQIINFGRVAVFSTCNRIEIYGIAQDSFSAWEILYSLRRKFPRLFSKTYVKVNSDETVKHALRLACGLESPILGELQIIDQLGNWLNNNFLPPLLKVMWQESLSVAKDIRLKAGIDTEASDIIEFVLNDLDKYVNSKEQKEIVVIGTGKLAQLISQKRLNNVKLCFASRKKHSRAKKLARDSNGHAILLNDLSKRLLTADAVISATVSPHYVIKREHLLNIAPKRNKVLYLYDLAVSGDIEPDVANIKNVFLQDLDSLAYLFRQYNQNFRPFVIRAELLIKESWENIREKIDDCAYQSQSRNTAELIGV